MIRPRPTKKNVACLALALLIPTAIALVPATGFADDHEGEDEGPAGSFYLDYLVGVSHHPDGTIRGANSASVGLFGKARPAPVGYFVGGSLGGYVTDAIRAEVQVGFRLSEIDEIRVRGENPNAKNSTMSLFTVMYNAYYDFDLSEYDVPVTPWLGLGIGWGMPRLDAQNTPGPLQLQIDDTASTMVYNFMGGVNVPLSDIADLTLGYRYLASIEYDITGTTGGVRQRFEYEYGAHEAFTGVRFRF